jgi:hypothetical protein
MKIRIVSRLSVWVLAAWLLAGCTTTPMNRIDANRSLYDSWPVEVRQAVLDGRVEKGMTPEMVEMSIGKPSQKETRPGRQGADEVWIYGGSGSSPLKGANIGVGVGPVYVGGLGGGSGASTAEYREVVFQNGAVVSGDDKL